MDGWLEHDTPTIEVLLENAPSFCDGCLFFKLSNTI